MKTISENIFILPFPHQIKSIIELFYLDITHRISALPIELQNNILEFCPFMFNKESMNNRGFKVIIDRENIINLGFTDTIYLSNFDNINTNICKNMPPGCVGFSTERVNPRMWNKYRKLVVVNRHETVTIQWTILECRHNWYGWFNKIEFRLSIYNNNRRYSADFIRSIANSITNTLEKAVQRENEDMFTVYIEAPYNYSGGYDSGGYDSCGYDSCGYDSGGYDSDYY